MHLAPAILHCSMSRRHAAMMLLAHGGFPLKVHAFRSNQICQTIKISSDLVPFLVPGLAPSMIKRTLSAVDLPVLQMEWLKEWQPSQVATSFQH